MIETITHDEYILIHVLKEFFDMKEEIKNSNNRKKSNFFKEQEARELLGNLLGAKILILGNTPLVNPLF